MKIEAELKNTKPMPPRQRDTLNILFTASWLECMISRSLRPHKLTSPQYNILRILNGSYPKGLSILDIKSRMLDRSSNVSRLVEKLRLRKMVERIPDESDRRMVVVSISELGKKTLQEIDLPTTKSDKKDPGNNMTEEELQTLGDLLDKFRG